MGSQTLEILRQGIWASVTGGWFYDPHQNIFCNAVHLYLWLFLLCLPFTIYLYVPPSLTGWCVYCTLVAILISFVKLLNHGLHHMYDTTECIVVPMDNSDPSEKRHPQNKQRDDEGIEMQMLGTSRISSGKQHTDNESVASLEYHKPIKTMDLKVDVHRKNSSESSAEDISLPHRPVVETVSIHHAEVVSGPSEGSSRVRYTKKERKRWKRSQDATERSKIDEISSEEGLRMEQYSKMEDTVAVNLDDDGATTKVSQKMQAGGNISSDFYKEWLYWDATEARDPYQSKFARQLSSDSRDNSEVSINGLATSPGRSYFGSHPSESCTKSAIALTQPNGQSASNMRRNSNSTMSTIQLPLLNSTAQLVSEMRRHSNVTNASLGFLPTGSVELGAYMLEKSNVKAPAGKGKSKSKSRLPGVRRIKSAALEIGCPPPSVSNLCPHPNSAEAIGGQVLKNPKSAVLPPPSKSLMRNPHLNLWPKNSNNNEAYPYMNYGSEIVYPIAEISDEMQTSQCQDSDLDSVSSQSYTDYEDNRNQLRGFDSDFNRPLEVNSSDTEYENNGSRSPLLDRTDCLNDVRIIKSKGDKRDLENKKHLTCDRNIHKNNSFSVDTKHCDKIRNIRNKKIVKNNSFSVGTSTAEDVEITVRHSDNNYRKNLKYDNNDSAKQKYPMKLKTFTPEYFNRTSVSSKDVLLEKSSVDSDDGLLDDCDKTADKEETDTAEAIKKTDLEISNSSASLEMQDARQELATEASDISEYKTVADSHSKSTPAHARCESESRLSSDESSYGFSWLFEEPTVSTAPSNEDTISSEEGVCDCNQSNPRPGPSRVVHLSEVGHNIQKNLGAIPKQLKNFAKSRTCQKENKNQLPYGYNEFIIPKKPLTEEEVRESLEAQAEHVLETFFAVTKASSLVMPAPLMIEDMRRISQREQIQQCRHDAACHRGRKKSIEEAAQSTTNTILPTSMPLLAAFLNSRPDLPPIPWHFQPDSEAGPSHRRDYRLIYEPTYRDVHNRSRPLSERNHKHRMRKIKRPSRHRTTPPTPPSVIKNRNCRKRRVPPASNLLAIHMATSFNDTSDGAIHTFQDEYGNWMSYTFDKTSSGEARPNVTAPSLTAVELRIKERETKIAEIGDAPMETGGASASISIHSDSVDVSFKSKKGDGNDQGVTSCSMYSSSNPGSNNPLISSNSNSTSVIPVAASNTSNNRTFVVENAAVPEPPRHTVAFPEILMERMERHRMNFIMGSGPAPGEPVTANMLHIALPVSSSIGDNSLDLSAAPRSRFAFYDAIEKFNRKEPKSYYKLKLSKCWEIKVTMDRLKLLALFDRNLTIKETFVSIMLSIMVAVLGATVLHIGFYRHIYAFWFCFIMAGSQYSLLKSVQPDSASPIHGFNKMVVFSRPIYFCLCSAILCGIHYHLENYIPNETARNRRSADALLDKFTIFGLRLRETDVLLAIQVVLSNFILFFPLAFSLGLFPQVNTFLMYLFEQIDMHIFGGNATASLSASIYCVTRSLLAIGVLYGFAYGGLTEAKSTQHILFSMFCALIIPVGYHLSRSASDYSAVWNLIKTHLLPTDLHSIYSTESSNADLAKPIAGETISEKSSKNKNNSESNISKQHSIGSSASRINFSSETNISKNQKRSQTPSIYSLKMESRIADNINSSGSIKMDNIVNEAGDSKKFKVTLDEKNSDEDVEDPLPRKLQETVNSRFKNDVIVCSFMALFIFGIHCTTVFSTLQPELNPIVWSITAILGWILHYLMPQMRKQQPWLWLSGPVLKSHEYAQYEVQEPARVMWFEKAYVYLCFVERNILYPVIFISAATQDSPVIALKFGSAVGSLIVCICTLKCIRNAYSDTENQYLILIFAVLLFRLDIQWASETFIMDYFLMAIIYNKTYEFLLKIQFVVTYIAPWQITWGSAFHAFAQPFSVPHSAMLFLQAVLSAILSTPLNPVLGSAIFMTSYVRPVKFWERDYNTKRVDTSNTRLSSQLERNLGSDDNNLNSIFYEHLARSLQHYLCGDLSLGRWGQVQQGDCFVLASDSLNCLVHIVEIGNGLVSFQLRGLEFRGTYCQQREVEAISEGPEENDGCCCCAVGHLPRMLSVNAMCSLRWLAWQLTTAKYVLEGYSISDNSAVSMLQVFDFRKVLITYYVKSIIYYTTQSPKLEEWLSSPSIIEALKPTQDRNFVDLDPIFNVNLDEDYDFRASGITRSSFCTVYQEWISYCGSRREELYRKSGERMTNKDSALMSLCFALSLIGRRSLVAASHNTVSSVEFFLFGLHALFKGDFRITCVRDEWVFSDMSLLHSVLAPAVRMALKLHQDHFMSPEEYGSCSALFSAIKCHASALVICHESAPAWRANVLRGAPHLLALRHVMDDGTDEYKIIMLNKRQLSFRVIKLNRECVRGLWAGQQQELIYLRNRNPERGSIQNAKQALRNIINSSCDQPIGYPIYVSPLTTSYAETSTQLSSLVGGALTLGAIRKKAVDLWRRIRRRCGEGCSSGSAAAAECGIATVGTATTGSGGSVTIGRLHQTPRRALDLSRCSLGTRGSLASVGKPTSSTLASLAGLLGSREHSLGTHHERDGNVNRERGGTFYCDREDPMPYAPIRETFKCEGFVCDRETDPKQLALRQQLIREGRQSSIKDRVREGVRRSKRDRDRIRPASFRMLSAHERDGNIPSVSFHYRDGNIPPIPIHYRDVNIPSASFHNKDGNVPSASFHNRDGNVPSTSFHNDGYELHSLRDERESCKGGIFREKDNYDMAEKEGKYKEKDSRNHGYKDARRTASGSSKTSSNRPPTPHASSEDLSLNFVMTANGCQIIANRSVNQKYPLPYSNPSHKRRSSDVAATSQPVPTMHQSEKCIDNLQSTKDLRNVESSSEHSVLRRLCGENSRELTKANKETKLDLTGKYNELSSKETHLRFEAPKDDNFKPSKVKVKRSESLKSELKSHVSIGCKVVVVDPTGVHDSINLGRRTDVSWPTEYAREKGGKNSWGLWYPTQGMDGEVVHRWLPNHRDPKQRSHIDKTILLVQIDDKFVPIVENCVQDLGDEV